MLLEQYSLPPGVVVTSLLLLFYVITREVPSPVIQVLRWTRPNSDLHTASTCSHKRLLQR